MPAARQSTMSAIWNEMTRLLSSWKVVRFGLVLVILVALFGELRNALNREDCFENNSVVTKPHWAIPVKNSIAPGELPGYTGWARPENTLARYFDVKMSSTNTRGNAKDFLVSVECTGHEDCVVDEACASRFFLRAYGPSVVGGRIVTRSRTSSGCLYEFHFGFYDPGVYTVEVVLTVSKPPPMDAFPLDKYQDEPNYEGYLLPGFPLTTTVDEIPIATPTADNEELCLFEDLIETSTTSALEKARWKVTGKNNERHYYSKTMNSSLVSTLGYVENVNSLGIHMEYQYVNGCRLLKESSLDMSRSDKRPVLVGGCNGPQEKLHIVYIGDSVLRVQKDTLRKMLKGIPSDQVELTFLSLHGGYRLNQELGPSNVTSFLQDLRTKRARPNEKIVVLFNTGLHDIHRLCGAEFREERPTYLNKDLSSFRCLEEYKLLLKDFLKEMDDFPAALKVFQSTTAAWPKYGNYGIQWGQNGQGMVLTSDFVKAFNDVAFEALKDYKEIPIMDGYWITYPRPDNREVGDIGKKLSHPGYEVLSAMTRKWVMLILDRVCLPLVV